MAGLTITLERLPDVHERGPFSFTLEHCAGFSVLTIPIVLLGPESHAVSTAQERWVQARYPELEMSFAGGWRTSDRARIDAIAVDLRALAAAVGRRG